MKTLAQVIADLTTIDAYRAQMARSINALTGGIQGTCTDPYRDPATDTYLCGNSGGVALNYTATYPNDNPTDPMNVIQSGLQAAADANIPAIIVSLSVNPGAAALQAAATNVQYLAGAMGAIGPAANAFIANTNYSQWAGLAYSAPPATPGGYDTSVPAINATGPLDPMLSFDSTFQSGGVLVVDSAALLALVPPVQSPILNAPGLTHPGAPSPSKPKPPKLPGVTPTAPSTSAAAGDPAPPPVPAPVAPVPASNTGLYVGGAVLAVGIGTALAFAMRKPTVRAVRR